MRFGVMVGVAFLLYRGDPALFGWDAAGFRTFLVFLAVTVVLVLAPGRGDNG